MIYMHKESELADVQKRFPATHYVLVDDKLRILSAVKASWGKRVTTVFVEQGHYATVPTRRDLLMGIDHARPQKKFTYPFTYIVNPRIFAENRGFESRHPDHLREARSFARGAGFFA